MKKVGITGELDKKFFSEYGSWLVVLAIQWNVKFRINIVIETMSFRKEQLM